MSWDGWAAPLTANGANACGAIIAGDGSSVWGKSGAFSLTTYQTSINDGEGGTKQVNVNEGQRVVAALNAKGVPSKKMMNEGGLFINQTKYRVVRYDSDLDACYLKGPGSTGACIQRTKQAIVFCSYDKKNKGQDAGPCNMATEKLAAQLIAQGY